MSAPLPRLRVDLDFMPSPVEDRPGLLIRDSFRYSDKVLIIPSPLVPALACFDGVQTSLDLRAKLVALTGELSVRDLEQHITGILAESGFLDDETFAALKEAAERNFVQAPVREPSQAGSAYPDQPEELRETLNEWMGGPVHSEQGLIAIAAPHVSPAGGYESYRAAYQLGPEHKEKTFVILGTSHYGAPNRFGLTRKPYATPWGNAQTDTAIIDELTRLAPHAVATEDYCHAVEHSIEFQVIYLQWLYGPDIRIVPILCGSYAQSIYRGGMPEDDDHVNRFLGALGDLAAREKDRLFWVLGIDMAHMGRRYGDGFAAIANQMKWWR